MKALISRYVSRFCLHEQNRISIYAFYILSMDHRNNNKDKKQENKKYNFFQILLLPKIQVNFCNKCSQPFTVKTNRNTHKHRVISKQNIIQKEFIPLRNFLNKVITKSVSYTHLRAHETRHDLVCRLLLEK